MAYFETGGLNFWEILGLALVLIWAVNRYFRKRNEADNDRTAMFPGAIDLRKPMDHGLMKYMEEDSRRQHDDITDEMAARRRDDLFTNIRGLVD